MIPRLLYILFALVEFAAAGFMFAKHRRQPDRSRVFIAVFFLLSALSAVFVVVSRTFFPETLGQRNSPHYILLGFVVFFMLLLYPIEVLRPRWMTWPRTLKILSPWLFFVLCLLAVAPLGLHTMSSVKDILLHIGETNVFLQVVLSLIFIPYGLWLCLMDYNWRKSSAPRDWLRLIVAIAMLMTLTFSCTRIFNLRWATYAHLFLYFLLTYIILRVELVIRFRVPSDVDEERTAEEPPLFEEYMPEHPQTAALPRENEAGASCGSDADGAVTGSEAAPDEAPTFDGANVSGSSLRADAMGLIKERLRSLMDNPDVWQNPDLTAGELRNMVGTNSNYLQRAIKEMGWQSYSDMINRKRIEYVCRELAAGGADNVQDIFYRAGYRSRVTAWRNFTAITGASPIEWVSEGKTSGTGVSS